MVAAACGDDDTLTTATSTTIAPASPDITATSSTTTSVPADRAVSNGTALVTEGDVNETARAFQWLLECNGYGPLTIDGAYGPASRAAMEAAQADLGREVTGSPDDETFAIMSRSCGDTRPVVISDHDFGGLSVVGNTAPEDPEVLSLRVDSGDQLEISVTSGADVSIEVLNSAGIPVGTATDSGGWETVFSSGGDYLIRVTAPFAATFETRLQFFKSDAAADEVILAHRGLILRGQEYYLGTEAGADADTVVDAVTAVLGDPSSDSGWLPHHEAIGAERRNVSWDSGLTLFFDDLQRVDGGLGAGGPRLFKSYDYSGGDGIRTVLQGIDVGSAASEVEAAVTSYRPEVGLDAFEWAKIYNGFWVLRAGNGEFGVMCFLVDSMATEVADDAEVVFIYAGRFCPNRGE